MVENVAVVSYYDDRQKGLMPRCNLVVKKSLNEEDKVLYRDVVKSTVNRYYFLKWECERLELDDNDFFDELIDTT